MSEAGFTGFIGFSGNERSADAAGNEVQQLGQQSRQAAADVDKLSDEAREAAIGVTSFVSVSY